MLNEGARAIITKTNVKLGGEGNNKNKNQC